MSMNTILLRRSNKFLLTGKRGTTSAAVIATFNKNIQDLGYTLSPTAVSALKKTDTSVVLKEVISTLKELRGVKNYRPMYPNFPAQVMEADEAELYLNAIFHYFSFVVADALEDSSIIWLPKYKKDAREPLDEKVKLTVLDIGTDGDLRVMANRIATSNTSLSETDKEDLRTLIKAGYLTVIDTIPNKENLAVVGATLLSEKIGFGLVSEQFKTATDVLRLATALSGGDVSLAENSKFKSFSRLTRRILMGLLEAAESREEDMLRWQTRWVKLAEYLHVGEFWKKFPKTYGAILKLRNKYAMEANPILTFGSKVESAIRSGEVRKAITFLSRRPGDFARRLDHLLRLDQVSAGRTIDAFEEVVDDVSTPVLLQVLAHFKGRNQSNMRVVFPKGSLAKVQAIDGVRGVINYTLTDRVVDVVTDALTRRFAKLPKLGKVYVDPKLENYLVPFSQRSANASLRTLVRLAGRVIRGGAQPGDSSHGLLGFGRGRTEAYGDVGRNR